MKSDEPLMDAAALEAFWREKKREQQERTRPLREAEKPLVAELNSAGFRVTSAWDLVNSPLRYDEAIPILLSHLPKRYPDAIRDGIARALAVPEASYAWPMIVEEFKKTSNEAEPFTKEGLGVAIRVLSNPSRLPEIIELLKDKSHGDSRVMFLGVLRRYKRPEAVEALEYLADDPDLTREMARWKPLKSNGPRPKKA